MYRRGFRGDVRRRLLREWRLELWERHGSLYHDRWFDDIEARLIREECEQLGEIPMGYGRVTRLPIQLNDDEARRQFGAERRRR